MARLVVVGVATLGVMAIDAAVVPRAANLFSFDATWKPQLPVGGHTYSGVGIANNGRAYLTQRGNTSVAPVIVLDTASGQQVGAWGMGNVGIANPGSPNATWGSHGIAVENCDVDCSPSSSSQTVRVWVEDFTNHVVTAFTAEGQEIVQVGQKGVAGNGTDPLQFGNVADAAIQTGQTASDPTIIYATDGDGGYDNRVVKFSVSPAATATSSQTKANPTIKVDWVTPHEFNSPHSIALHERTNLLVVADRGHSAVKILDASTGNDLGTWDCGLNFGPDGVPFGVRTLTHGGHDMVLVASMDNPQDHKNQYIHVLDASKLSASSGSASPCSVLQTITIDPAEYSGPHLLGVDATTGDLYAVLVADKPLSTVLRYSFAG
eukprot:m.127483 g.127483  ORF g.127483 m.127483 type:complete len:377 (+) comp11211_c1_seq4:26-1156(+)